MGRIAGREPGTMAETDKPEGLTGNPFPDTIQLEAEMVAALRAIACDEKAQSAARATAAKAVLDWLKLARGAAPGNGGTDPGALSLEAIDDALRRLGSG
jgi:hypothetical protein